jgi:hypothetical protein
MILTGNHLLYFSLQLNLVDYVAFLVILLVCRPPHSSDKLYTTQYDSWIAIVLLLYSVLRIHMFLGLLADPIVRDMDPNPAPDPFIIKQK